MTSVVKVHRASNTTAISVVMFMQLVQIWTNYHNGSTGQLSAVTVTLLFGGALARIFTSVQETGDSTVIATFVVSFTVNAILLFQVIYYWNSLPPATANPSDKSK